jgi:two-component system NtrC family sensor kinase
MEKEIKILFVDDEENVLNAVKRVFFDEEDYTIFTASSAAEGIVLLGGNQVQVVVSDYRMPGTDGVEFLREVNNRWPETVRILLSGYADVTSIIAAINEGQVYKFIPKPWNEDELRVAISNALERYFLHQKNVELTHELSVKNAELTRLNVELQKLLEEQTENLEFRSKVVTTYQNILNAIPAGIVGIDSNNILALCNSTWITMSGKSWGDLGQTADRYFSGDINQFILQANATGSIKKRLEINGIWGILSGAVMQDGDDRKGVILVFMREDDV